MNIPLKYTKEIDSNLIKSIEDDLHLNIISVEKFESGEVSFTFKIKLSDNKLFAKVFRFDNFVSDKEKLFWIEKQLSLKNIRFAKTLLLKSNSKHFPYGYMVQEFIEGITGFQAIMDEKISFEDFLSKYIVLLKQVHTIPTEGFGDLKNGRGEYNTFSEYKQALYKETYQKLKNLPDLKENIHHAVLQEVEKLTQFNAQVKPCLLHGDPGTDNAIMKNNGEIILIDWDNAKSSSWIDEYAGMTFRGTYMYQYKTDNKRQEIVKKVFKNSYKGINFEDTTLLEIERILHILTAYYSLAVHLYQHENKELYEIAKKRLEKLLTN